MKNAVIWDIGGVLLTDPKIGDFWKNSEKSKKIREEFGSGKISVEEFIRQGARLLNISEESFLKKYKEIYYSIDPMTEIIDLYKRVKVENYIFSDTNPIHGENIRKKFPEIFTRAKKIYFSYEIGRRKNSIEVFNFVINDINLDSSEILFIDNKEEIISLAEKIGLKTIHFVGAKELKEELKMKELI